MRAPLWVIVISCAVLAGCASPVPSPTREAMATTLPAASPSPSPSAPPAAVLSVNVGHRFACASEGGCAVFFLVQSAPGDPAGVSEDWRLEGGPGADWFHLPAGARTTLPPDRYRVAAHVNWVSDVIMGGQTPAVGGQVSSCDLNLTVGRSDVAVRVQVTFDKDPCKIAITATSS